MPEQDNLIDLLETAIAEVGKVRQELREEKRARKITTILGGFLLAVLGIFGIFTYQNAQDIEKARQEQVAQACESANISRAGLRDSFAFLVQAATAGQEQTAEEQATAEAFIQGINERFPDRDCDAE